MSWLEKYGEWMFVRALDSYGCVIIYIYLVLSCCDLQLVWKVLTGGTLLGFVNHPKEILTHITATQNILLRLTRLQ